MNEYEKTMFSMDSGWTVPRSLYTDVRAEIDALRKELDGKDSVLNDCKLLIEEKIAEIDRLKEENKVYSEFFGVKSAKELLQALSLDHINFDIGTADIINIEEGSIDAYQQTVEAITEPPSPSPSPSG